MSDPAPETKESQAAEAAAIRRRWISLGEGVAVLAVLISALTLYLNWADKREERTEKAAESSKASARASAIVLRAASVKDDRIAIAPGDPAHIIQSQTLIFPSALGLAPVDTSGDARIEAEWFEGALKKARDRAKLPDESVGDEKLPVAITTRFTAGGDMHESVALYDIGYGIAGGWIAGHRLSLRGLSRVDALRPDVAKAAVDARWARLTAKRP
ncbi:hypothetical protein [Sphingobium sp. CCH11-B1]|jgi:hypothetical protein|uniref:hypothetical protein n=1 Tax=Sphingobium sp. CCH11-B1 TaxID=1768781 RepID=UPI00083091BD|nr:hypothetical protein [Sphingobium sp. CCH11-B1]MEA3390326.1 hypothetical protein [Pseudomonadota bacterium]